MFHSKVLRVLVCPGAVLLGSDEDTYSALSRLLEAGLNLVRTTASNVLDFVRNMDREKLQDIIHAPAILAGRFDGWLLVARLRSSSLEVTLALLFAWAPLALLVFCYWSAITVHQFVSIAKYLQWRTNVAAGIGRDLVCGCWKIALKLYHGHEYRGFEHIPTRGAAMLVWYHGNLPVDYFGLIAEIQLKHGRVVKSVVDRCLTVLPGFHLFEKYLGCFCQGREHCVTLLQDGELMGVAPGGSREALLSQEYTVQWGSRIGFAEVALKANVPVIPVFTQNIDQAFKKMKLLEHMGLHVFESTRIPAMPVYGGFPVKLVTHIGEPIMPAVDDTPETLRDKVAAAIQGMIQQHQQDVTMTRALKERWTGVNHRSAAAAVTMTETV